jgi:hypothetical protein
MAVVEATIAADLLTLYNAAKAGMSESDFADGMASIIASAILSATVNAGAAVATPDTLVGTVTGPGTLS